MKYTIFNLTLPSRRLKEQFDSFNFECEDRIFLVAVIEYILKHHGQDEYFIFEELFQCYGYHNVNSLDREEFLSNMCVLSNENRVEIIGYFEEIFNQIGTHLVRISDAMFITKRLIRVEVEHR